MGNHCRDEVLHQPWGLVNPNGTHTMAKDLLPTRDGPGQVGGGGD